MARATDPVKQTLRAGKRVGKALDIFEKAAEDLERASAEHLAAFDQLNAQVDAKFVAADKAYEAALRAAEEARAYAYESAFALDALAEANEVAAEQAQAQADNIRGLLAVA